MDTAVDIAFMVVRYVSSYCPADSRVGEVLLLLRASFIWFDCTEIVGQDAQVNSEVSVDEDD